MGKDAAQVMRGVKVETKTPENKNAREVARPVNTCEIDLIEFIKQANLQMVKKNAGCDKVVLIVKYDNIKDFSKEPGLLDYFVDVAEGWVSYKYAVQRIDTDFPEWEVEWVDKNFRKIKKADIKLNDY